MSSIEDALAQAGINMASATDALNDLNGRMNAVQAAGIQGIVDLAASMTQVFWVDPAGGDDTATGSAAAPLKTLNEVQRRTPVGARVYVKLLGDLVITQDVTVHSTFLISPADGVTMPVVSAGGAYLHSNGEVFSHGFDLHVGGQVAMHAVRVGLAQWGGGGPVQAGASLFKSYDTYASPSKNIGLSQCEFDPGASPVGAVCGLRLASMVVWLPIEITSMLGRWSIWATSTSGTDPLTVRQLTTDLVQI